MSELTLVGLHDDGEHVVLEDPEGHQFRVRIDEALRAAVRRDRPHLELARAELASLLPPREIQARIRAGSSAEEVAEQSSTPLDVIRRYEGPVLAEREFVSGRARSSHIGHDPGSPELGDLVTDRLASRGVPIGSIRWDAFRRSGRPWTVEVCFEFGGRQRSARWVYDAAAGRVRAQDDEARWLSETELTDEPIRRHLSPVRDAVFDVEVDAAVRPVLAAVDLPLEAPPDPDETQTLLDELSGKRGVRQLLDPDEDNQLPEFGPQHTFGFHRNDSVPAAHPPASHPEEALDARVVPVPGGQEAGAESSRPEGLPRRSAADSDAPARPGSVRRTRKGRASVPSWDEIVFGAKPE